MKTQEIDIVKLYAKADNVAWNNWLTKCLNQGLINELVYVRRGLQMGMKSAEKKKLVDESLATTFLRWQHSIELTIKKIVKAKKGPLQYGDKKDLDNELEKYLRKEGY